MLYTLATLFIKTEPNRMPNYRNGKIYSVRCYNDDTLIYIGSTTQSLPKRWGDHNKDFKYGNHLPFHKLIVDIKDWYIQLEEEFPCDNKEQLNRREGKIQRELGTINKNKAGRTKKEYYFDNKDILLEYQNQYRSNNKDTIIEKTKKYNKENKDYFKQYYIKNREQRLEYQKQYYIKNKIYVRSSGSSYGIKSV